MLEKVCIVLILLLMKWGTGRLKPVPIPIGNGDTLMVRVVGYGFCPKYCNIDHSHFGHKKGYKCGEDTCGHIIL